jgi:transcription elongation factor Elf1
MTIISKSALVNNIKSVQLKLSDFTEGKSDFKKTVEKYAISQDKKENINHKLSILDNGQYGALNPVCPDCGSLKYVKQGFRQINPKLDDGEKIKIDLQRYKCKNCGKKYSVDLRNVKMKNKNFFKTVHDKIRETKKNRGGSLRKIAEDVHNILKS